MKLINSELKIRKPHMRWGEDEIVEVLNLFGYDDITKDKNKLKIGNKVYLIKHFTNSNLVRHLKDLT